MLKRFALGFASLALVNVANASPETAEDWGAQASGLYQTTVELLSSVEAGQAIDLDPVFTNGLATFSATAGRLAIWVDTDGGAKDFACIYRGMAEEAELQLYALEDADGRANAKSALTRIATMLDDAQSIAAASAYAARHGMNTSSTGACPAGTITLDKYAANPY